mgnify:CR=1 FL=1
MSSETLHMSNAPVPPVSSGPVVRTGPAVVPEPPVSVAPSVPPPPPQAFQNTTRVLRSDLAGIELEARAQAPLTLAESDTGEIERVRGECRKSRSGPSGST